MDREVWQVTVQSDAELHMTEGTEHTHMRELWSGNFNLLIVNRNLWKCFGKGSEMTWFM